MFYVVSEDAKRLGHERMEILVRASVGKLVGSEPIKSVETHTYELPRATVELVAPDIRRYVQKEFNTNRLKRICGPLRDEATRIVKEAGLDIPAIVVEGKDYRKGSGGGLSIYILDFYFFETSNRIPFAS